MEPEEIVRTEWYEIEVSLAGEDDFCKYDGNLALVHVAQEFSNQDAATTEMRRRAKRGDPVKELNRKFDYRVVKKSIVWEVVASVQS